MTLFHQTFDCDFYLGNVLDVAGGLAPRSVHVVVTSPPYFGLRDYGIAPSLWGGDPNCKHEWSDTIIPAKNGIVHPGGMSGETLSGNSATRKPRTSSTCTHCSGWMGVLGLEPLHDCLGWAKETLCSTCFICHMRMVAASIWRVLRDDGTFWLNISDSYGTGTTASRSPGNRGIGDNTQNAQDGVPRLGLKAKDRVGIPQRLALALQSDGWIWRDEKPLCKVAPMPESVTDRSTSAHEMLYLFTKKPRYYYDSDAVRERTGNEMSSGDYGSMPVKRFGGTLETRFGVDKTDGGHITHPLGRNPRSWMMISPDPSNLNHYAQFVGGRTIPRFAILAGTSEHGVCATCGAPWQRVSDITYHPIGANPKSGNKVQASHPRTIEDIALGRDSISLYQPQNMKHGRATKTVTTTGWSPTCKHDAEIVPATVWDPFSGSGTTEVVARELGRRSIYTDLSEQYAQMAIKRLEGVTPMLETMKAASPGRQSTLWEDPDAN